jgi:hypothetical protein
LTFTIGYGRITTMRHNTVYRTVNLVNGCEYTGKHETDDLDDGYLGSGNLIKRAIEKHGRENFRKVLLHDFDSAGEMDAKEAELVTEEYCARKDTYNICPGGRGGWGYVYQNGLWDTEQRLEAAKKNVELAGVKLSQLLETDLKFKEQWIKAISTSLLGKQTWWTGRSHTPEARENMRRNHNPNSHPRGPRGPYKKKGHIPL